MVTVKLFGTLRLDTGVKEFTADAHSARELPPLLMKEILRRQPDTALTERDLRSCLIAVNGTLTGPRARLRDGDLVCLFPAAAGG